MLASPDNGAREAAAGLADRSRSCQVLQSLFSCGHQGHDLREANDLEHFASLRAEVGDNHLSTDSAHPLRYHQKRPQGRAVQIRKLTAIDAHSPFATINDLQQPVFEFGGIGLFKPALHTDDEYIVLSGFLDLHDRRPPGTRYHSQPVVSRGDFFGPFPFMVLRSSFGRTSCILRVRTIVSRETLHHPVYRRTPSANPQRFSMLMISALVAPSFPLAARRSAANAGW